MCGSPVVNISELKQLNAFLCSFQQILLMFVASMCNKPKMFSPQGTLVIMTWFSKGFHSFKLLLLRACIAFWRRFDVSQLNASKKQLFFSQMARATVKRKKNTIHCHHYLQNFISFLVIIIKTKAKRKRKEKNETSYWEETNAGWNTYIHTPQRVQRKGWE